MKVNHWTLALAAAGVVSFGAAAQAEEATESVKTFVSDTTISGYVSTSAIWRPGTSSGAGSYYPAASTAAAFHGPAKHDGFNLDVIDLTISKALDESEWAAGYKAELWFGPDAGTYATGSGSAHLAIKQAYAALRAPVGNGIDFKIGVWDTIIGHEVANGPENPNYTRSLAWSIQPTTHTGLLAGYRFNDLFAVVAGVANTRGPVINARSLPSAGSESVKSYMAGAELTAPDSWGFLAGSKLHAQVIDSPNSTTAAGNDSLDVHVGATLNTPLEALKVGASYYYGGNIGTPTGTIGAPTSTYASVWGLYTTYAATEKLNFNLRGEYATATAGTFYPGAATDNDPNNALIALTLTTDYSLWENVISRLEVRWDRAVDGGRGSGAGPFGGSVGAAGADEDNAVLIAANIIYKF
jgi:hypothetical protein